MKHLLTFCLTILFAIPASAQQGLSSSTRSYLLLGFILVISQDCLKLYIANYLFQG